MGPLYNLNMGEKKMAQVYENKLEDKKASVKEVSAKEMNTSQPYIKNAKPTDKDLKYEADRDMELVKGVFKNHENPGEVFSFWYRGHKGHEIERYDLRDGEERELPLCVARHLRKDCWYSIDQMTIDKVTGLPVTEVGKKVRRCSFYTVGFVDYEDMSEVGVPYIAPRV
jgi:hypothetical protein